MIEKLRNIVINLQRAIESWFIKVDETIDDIINDDDDFTGNIVMEPKPEYKSTKGSAGGGGA